jgi:predicted DNA-binding protein (UPF0251 family)
MRRRLRRRVQFNFKDYYFKPRGIPLSSLDEIKISNEELETLRLRYLKKIDQHEAAKQMGVSQSQYQRDITKALEKITKALIEGKALLICRPDSQT